MLLKSQTYHFELGQLSKIESHVHAHTTDDKDSETQNSTNLFPPYSAYEHRHTPQIGTTTH